MLSSSKSQDNTSTVNIGFDFIDNNLMGSI